VFAGNSLWSRKGEAVLEASAFAYGETGASAQVATLGREFARLLDQCAWVELCHNCLLFGGGGDARDVLGRKRKGRLFLFHGKYPAAVYEVCDHRAANRKAN
jgi:hypothetical protein